MVLTISREKLIENVPRVTSLTETSVLRVMKVELNVLGQISRIALYVP